MKLDVNYTEYKVSYRICVKLLHNLWTTTDRVPRHIKDPRPFPGSDLSTSTENDTDRSEDEEIFVDVQDEDNQTDTRLLR